MANSVQPPPNDKMTSHLPAQNPIRGRQYSLLDYCPPRIRKVSRVKLRLGPWATSRPGTIRPCWRESSRSVQTSGALDSNYPGRYHRLGTLIIEGRNRFGDENVKQSLRQEGIDSTRAWRAEQIANLYTYDQAVAFPFSAGDTGDTSRQATADEDSQHRTGGRPPSHRAGRACSSPATGGFRRDYFGIVHPAWNKSLGTAWERGDRSMPWSKSRPTFPRRLKKLLRRFDVAIRIAVGRCTPKAAAHA